MASVNDWRERTRLDATSASDGRQALNPARLLHYDLTAGSVTVQAVAYQLPAAARVRSLQQALGGALAPLASGLLIGAHEHGDGALLQLTIYCEQCERGETLGAVVARRTTDRTLAAWRQLRDRASALLRDHLVPASPPVAPWAVSEMPNDALPHHVGLDPWLQDTVRTLARAWLLTA